MKPRELIFLCAHYDDYKNLNASIKKELGIDSPFGLFYGTSDGTKPTHVFAFIEYSDKNMSWAKSNADSFTHWESYSGAYDLGAFCKNMALVRIPIVRNWK